MSGKTTYICANQSAPSPVHLQFGLSSNLKHFRIAVNLPCDIIPVVSLKENEVGDFSEDYAKSSGTLDRNQCLYFTHA